MIEVIVSDNCPHCKRQEEEMERYFFDDEYVLINAGSKEFLTNPIYSEINSVPFIVIKDDENNVIYSKVGFHDEEKLKKVVSDVNVQNNKNNGKYKNECK